jgi:hypothetical protein
MCFYFHEWNVFENHMIIIKTDLKWLGLVIVQVTLDGKKKNFLPLNTISHLEIETHCLV